MIYRAFSEINRHNYPYQMTSRIVKYQLFVINIKNLLGALYLISINLFLILTSKLVSLTRETARTLNTFFSAAGHVITGNLKVISDSRIRSVIAKGPVYRFPMQIDFQKCRDKIASSLNEFSNRWCKREHIEYNKRKYGKRSLCLSTLNVWKLNILKIIDRRFSFYSQNTNMSPRKPNISYLFLKSGM